MPLRPVEKDEARISHRRGTEETLWPLVACVDDVYQCRSGPSALVHECRSFSERRAKSGETEKVPHMIPHARDEGEPGDVDA